ncbi:hypothetical protein F2Q70_00043986 [Brassica cretica]|uniref:BZIP domain-containing protein n=1 Tax=Brassica cretica TaxID=69181 RepID=A0A8S9KEZ7_BRACR|nr:hypothetical protein F2Q70_00043986 [Brassica cretica]
MDSQRVIVEDPKSQSLNRQGSSLYSLTLDEVQTHLGSSGKSLGSMNLDELLKSVCSVEPNQPPSTAVNEEVVEKTVERKQKRMIKNRESAARSRARKQAYTHELEIKVSRLEEENERLRRQKEVEKILPSAPPPDPKRQLRRTSSAPF